MRNPFLLRSAQRITNEENFVQLFGARAIDLVSDVKDPFDGVVFVRGAPGGGKTTLLRLLTPKPLQMTRKFTYLPKVKETYDELNNINALHYDKLNLMGAMVTFTSEYQDVGDQDSENGQFKALLNSRIVLSTIRTVLEWFDKTYPDELDSLLFSWEPVSNATIPAKATGTELFEWASNIEEQYIESLDSLSSNKKTVSKHTRLDALKWFSSSKIFHSDEELTVKRVLLLDELQNLTSLQRERLLKVIVESRECCGIWIAERTEALDHYDLLSPGSRKNRDYESVINLEEKRSSSSFNSYSKLLNDIADIRVSNANGFNGRSFREFIDEENQLNGYSKALQRFIVDTRSKIEDGKKIAIYSEWVKWLNETKTSTYEQAINWRCAEILLSRNESRKQTEFDFPLATTQLQQEKSKLQSIAGHFLKTEINAPVYYGFKSLAMASSSNIDQFLAITGEIFEVISGKFIDFRSNSQSLSAFEQDKIIRSVAKTWWTEIASSIPNAGYAMNLLNTVGQFGKEMTFQPNAPYSNGVSGFAILLEDRDKLVDQQESDKNNEYKIIKETLSILVANNLLTPIPIFQGGKQHIVFYLNRLACVYFKLPMSYGGWKKKSLKTLHNWIVGTKIPSAK